ncbi:MAG TPA: [protein-PII] uridylyltransferase, partial [Bacteroidota bacterium]|nr:[protein-PII] uridylyltransferase [Bacteroidota bacterium]
QQCEKIHKELNDVATGSIGIERLLERHRMKWRRLSRSQSSSLHTAVEFEDHPRFTIIDVFAPDRLGFLYKITDALSGLGLNISFAKIATRADGIVDSFYVLDSRGGTIESADRKDSVRSSLLDTIRSVIDSELVQNQ